MRLLRPAAVLALLVTAVASPRTAATEDRLLQPPQQLSSACERLIVALFDVTGSFTRWLPRAIDHGRAVIARLEPGDCFVARPIGSESFQVENRLTGRVPRRLRPIDPPF